MEGKLAQFENIALIILGTVIASTKEDLNKAIDGAAAKLVEAVKNSETKLDETIARDLVVGALRRFADQIGVGLSAG